MVLVRRVHYVHLSVCCDFILVIPVIPETALRLREYLGVNHDKHEAHRVHTKRLSS